jgi:predicted DNA-binding protein (MmcQ/YjbR family)
MTAARRRPAASDPLPRLRELCLALPEAHEVEAWSEPTFRVRNKIFVMYASAASHHGKGRPAAWCNCTPLEQDLLLHADSRRFFKPPYVGPGGWIGVYLDRRPSWRALADIVREAYRLTAPARLVAQLDGVAEPARALRARRPAN